MRVRLCILLAPLLLVGCIHVVPPDLQEYDDAKGPILTTPAPGSDSEETRPPWVREPQPPHRAEVPANDPSAPDLWLDGYSVNGSAIEVRETAEHARYPCGGAVLAVPVEAPNPTSLRVDRDLQYNVSFRLEGPEGHTWVVDRYDAVAAPDNRSRSVWVANVLGGAVFKPDDGSTTCEPLGSGNSTYNVILYTMNMRGMLHPYPVFDERPATPESRIWWQGSPPTPWTP